MTDNAASFDTDGRLLDLLDDSLITKTNKKWELVRAYFGPDGHRIMSPTEPCDRCGKAVFLLLAKGMTKPVWLTFGELQHVDTLFPQIKTKRHECGDGESWSVEAALFVNAALREWAVSYG
jgi:hypothetical protein